MTHGDMATVQLPRRDRLVFIAFNSLMNLTTQENQLRCVTNAAAHLTDDGVFVVENVVPDPMYALHRRDGIDQFVHAEHVDTDGVTLEVGRYDRVTQCVDKCHLGLSQTGITQDPLALRHIWPSELDLMARLTGLRLRERHASWAGDPFVSGSTLHVSVYTR